MTKILKAGSSNSTIKTYNTTTAFRSFKIPKLNFDVTKYYDLTGSQIQLPKDHAQEQVQKMISKTLLKPENHIFRILPAFHAVQN